MSRGVDEVSSTPFCIYYGRIGYLYRVYKNRFNEFVWQIEQFTHFKK